MNRNVASIVYFSLQFIRGEPVRLAFDDLLKTQDYDLSALRNLQADRLLRLLRYAITNVPHYRDRFAGHESKIREASTWEDAREIMATLPHTTKEDYYIHGKKMVSKGIGKIKTTPNITSGSSGNPVFFRCDNLSWAYRHASMFRIMKMHNVEIGEPYAYFFGLHWSKQVRLKVFLKDVLFNRVRVSAFNINQDTLPAHYKSVMSKRTTHWIGYPSAIFEFCVLLRSLGLQVPGLKAIFTTAEPLFQYQRELIEEICGCRCVNIYGSVEGGIGAFEGPEGAMHKSMETSYLFNGPDNELYTTDLFLYANPFIKYKVGDICEGHEIRPNTKLQHEQMGLIIGRSGKPIVLPNGRRISANLPSYIFKNVAQKGLIRRYKFCQCQSKIFLLVVPSKSLDQLERNRLLEDCKKAFGTDTNIEIHEVSRIPLATNAKHMDYVTIRDESELYNYLDLQ